MKKIAVTAASGKLGSAVVSALTDVVEKEQVVALARTPSKAKGLGVEVRPGDYGAREALQASLSGIDALLLVSGMDAPEKRVAQHRNVLSAAKAAGVRKIVYTSIQGSETETGFSPVVQSNRQTEQDVIGSGLEWVIGRNGIYIEPDIEYLDNYRQDGRITNCAGQGRCGYTTRGELAFAYARMLTEEKNIGQIYNLHGQAITQQELAEYLNSAYGTELEFVDMPVKEYRNDRIQELGDFLGGVIAGIYEGIRIGAVDNHSHFAEVAEREHVDWKSFFDGIKVT